MFVSQRLTVNCSVSSQQLAMNKVFLSLGKTYDFLRIGEVVGWFFVVNFVKRGTFIAMGFKFEKLKVWRTALDLAFEVSKVIQEFPSHEKFVLGTQMQKAADSVVLNIAEGSTGQSSTEFKRFLNYSIRSALEVVTCLYLGEMRKLINKDDFTRLYNQNNELIKSIQALRNSLT
jgi:four helix bundle protein